LSAGTADVAGLRTAGEADVRAGAVACPGIIGKLEIEIDLRGARGVESEVERLVPIRSIDRRGTDLRNGRRAAGDAHDGWVRVVPRPKIEGGKEEPVGVAAATYVVVLDRHIPRSSSRVRVRELEP